MPKSKMDIYKAFSGETAKNSITSNLLKVPKQETDENSPKVLNSVKNGWHMADVLYLPQDTSGEKYCLVVVDQATGLCDAEALKSHSSKEVSEAIEKIYKRKILSKPQYLQVDSGTEFQDQFRTWAKNNSVELAVAKAGRSRQLSIVERRNQTLGKMIHQLQLAEEINTGHRATDWVNDLPRAVKLMNKKFEHKPKDYFDKPIRAEGSAKELLEAGTKVRVMLDKPKDYLTNKKLSGRFRSGDIRWSPQVYTIEQFVLSPDEPPMYRIKGIDNALYTKGQLQVVSDDEKAPATTYQKKFVFEKILDKKKLKEELII